MKSSPWIPVFNSLKKFGAVVPEGVFALNVNELVEKVKTLKKWLTCDPSTHFVPIIFVWPPKNHWY